MNNKILSRKLLEGIACGDSLGKMTSKYSMEEVLEIYGKKVTNLGQAIRLNSKRKWVAGDITDDTLLTLILADSLIEKRKFVREDFARRLINCPDPRGGSQIYKLKDSQDVNYMALDGDTNGAIIRLAALSIVYSGNSGLYDNILSQSTLTHAGIECLTGALLVSMVYNKIIQGKTQDEILSSILSELKLLTFKFLNVLENRTILNLKKALKISESSTENNICDRIEEEIGMSKWPFSSVVAAVIIGLKSKGTREILIDVVNRKYSGWDLDSTAAIVGAISYPFCKEECLSDWVKIIEDRNKISFGGYAEELNKLSVKND